MTFRRITDHLHPMSLPSLLELSLCKSSRLWHCPIKSSVNCTKQPELSRRHTEDTRWGRVAWPRIVRVCQALHLCWRIKVRVPTIVNQASLKSMPLQTVILVNDIIITTDDTRANCPKGLPLLSRLRKKRQQPPWFNPTIEGTNSMSTTSKWRKQLRLFKISFGTTVPKGSRQTSTWVQRQLHRHPDTPLLGGKLHLSLLRSPLWIS